MDKSEIKFNSELHDYILSVSLRESDVLRRLREETDRDPNAIMQIPPEQGQFMAFLVRALGAKKAIEIGTYTDLPDFSGPLNPGERPPGGWMRHSVF